MQTLSLEKILAGLNKQDNFVFLETARVTPQDYHSYLFTEPVDIVYCGKPDKIKDSLNAIEGSLKKGYFAAGFISYEAGFSFEESLSGKMDHGLPLLWFGIYKKPIVFDHRKVRFIDEHSPLNYSLHAVKPNISQKEYIDSIERIKSYIEKGHTYQVNYTFRLDFSFSGSVFGLYLNLRRKQSVSYSALIRLGGRHILSFSPELFFRKNKGLIQVKPMKGTASRGRYLKEDANNKELLHLCPKNRSENIMIVDLLRNDLGKISKINTVGTKKLFEVEGYESLLQMTSTVEAKIKPGLALYDLFKAVFPSGSVTGAPKIRTMQIISELETEPRGIYTGGIGFISPESKAVFNVAIRTLLIDTKQKKGEMGIGSGIVYDSNPQREYAECSLKSEFLISETPDFKLIETILWEADKGYFLLGLHLERLFQSTEYFNFLYNEKQILGLLKSKSKRFYKDKKYRVRLLLGKEGETTVGSSIIDKNPAERIITFSKKNRDSSDPFLFHKTTNRDTYDKEYNRCKEKGFYDIIFQNEKRQITEGAISNIFIKKNDIYYTPPLECGLLDGVYRRYIIKSKIFPVKEKILYLKDIKDADEVFLTNAVRGMVKVKIANNGHRYYV